jgi:leader peptidase (prepilin peptidase)/N-methyltransferase
MFDGFLILTIPPRDLPFAGAVISLALAFVWGSLWGSFLNVVIARVPMGQSVVSPRSRCPKCGTMITAKDNIPMISWLLLRAKCRQCQAPISARYPFVELLGGTSGMAVVARYGFTLPALELFVFILTLIAISFIDLDTFSVSEPMVGGFALAGLAFGAARWLLLAEGTPGHLAQHDVVDRVIGGVGAGLMLGAIIYVSTFAIRMLQERRKRAALARRKVPVAQRSKKKWRRREGAMRLPAGEWAMGWGDPMIFAAIGAYLGWQLLPLTLFMASLAGSIIGIGARLGGGLKNRAPIQLPGDEKPWTPPDHAIPFGPFLALGGLLASFFGDALLAHLLPLLGFGPAGAWGALGG